MGNPNFPGMMKELTGQKCVNRSCPQCQAADLITKVIKNDSISLEDKNVYIDAAMEIILEAPPLDFIPI